MNPEINQFKKKLRDISQSWLAEGIPSREKLDKAADALCQWKKEHHINGIWQDRPLMMTATLDDGIGQGLQVIERYAEVLGFEVKHLGLLQSPDTIVDQCHRWRPDVLGLTVLQLDSDDDLARVGHKIPPQTRLIAGGPAFKYDTQMAERCGVHYVASNVASFINYIMD